MDSSNEYEQEEETYLCLMIIYTENKINNLTFEFTYNELFPVYKKLDKDSVH